MAAISIRSHLWINWAEIAIENEAVARHARHELYPKDPSEGLRAEMHAGMIAVSASAHALDALYGELQEMIPLPESWRRKEPKTCRGPARHARIVETLKLGFALGKAAVEWPPRFEWLFDLRDSAVHFEGGFRPPVPHPVGVHTADTNVSYALESAQSTVDLLLEVLSTCAASPRDQLPSIVKWASDMTPTVEHLTSMRAET